MGSMLPYIAAPWILWVIGIIWKYLIETILKQSYIDLNCFYMEIHETVGPPSAKTAWGPSQPWKRSPKIRQCHGCEPQAVQCTWLAPDIFHMCILYIYYIIYYILYIIYYIYIILYIIYYIYIILYIYIYYISILLYIYISGCIYKVYRQFPCRCTPEGVWPCPWTNPDSVFGCWMNISIL